MVGIVKLSPQEASNYEGLEHKTKQEALINIRNLFSDWEPWQDSFWLNNAPNFASVSGMVAGIVYARHFK